MVARSRDVHDRPNSSDAFRPYCPIVTSSVTLVSSRRAVDTWVAHVSSGAMLALVCDADSSVERWIATKLPRRGSECCRRVLPILTAPTAFLRYHSISSSLQTLQFKYMYLLPSVYSECTYFVGVTYRWRRPTPSRARERWARDKAAATKFIATEAGAPAGPHTCPMAPHLSLAPNLSLRTSSILDVLVLSSITSCTRTLVFTFGKR